MITLQSIHDHRRSTITAVIILVAALLLFIYYEPLMYALGDADRVHDLIAQLGLWGPLALILINIIQIVIAPIPGYAVYLAAGYLYGWVWGGLWGSIGLLAGGMLAMYVGRQWGRPLVQRIIGSDTLAHWEQVAHSDSLLVWGAIFLSPIGDVPFLLAGLSRVSFRRIFVLAVVTRVPAAFAAAAIGSGAMQLTGWQITAVIVALAIPMMLLSRYQDALTDWFFVQTQQLIND